MTSEYEYVYVIIIILLFVVLRTRSQVNGRKADTRRIFTRPVLYAVLTLLLLAVTPSAYVLLLALLFGIIGYFVGTMFGSKSKVFEKDGIIRSKGSNEVFLIWIGAFILRLLIEIAFPLPTTYIIVGFSQYANPAGAYFWYMVVGFLLAFSAGMLLGEAKHIYKRYRSLQAKALDN